MIRRGLQTVYVLYAEKAFWSGCKMERCLVHCCMRRMGGRVGVKFFGGLFVCFTVGGATLNPTVYSLSNRAIPKLPEVLDMKGHLFSQVKC